MYSCEVREPYFSQLVSGEKEYEGRVRRKQWREISPGDTLLVSRKTDDPPSPTNSQPVAFQVVSLVLANNFDILYSNLGRLLLPIPPLTSASDLYSQFYTEHKIQKHGVVGVGLKKVDEQEKQY